jgi:hypothetical protein
MSDDNRTLKSNGSGIPELAVRAIEEDVQRDWLWIARTAASGAQYRHATGGSKPMADYLASNPQLREQLAFFSITFPASGRSCQPQPISDRA